MHPFENLDRKQLEDELRSRKLYDNIGSNKETMGKTLKNELRGIQRVPTLLFHTPNTEAFEELNLQFYEISSIEPMHDLAGHIKNILQEFGYHRSK